MAGDDDDQNQWDSQVHGGDGVGTQVVDEEVAQLWKMSRKMSGKMLMHNV